MLKATIAAAAMTIAMTMAVVPASAQHSQPPAAPPEADVVGFPVYSSDGQMLGEVIALANAGGKSVLRAEMGSFLGLGPSFVVIDADVFRMKADRIELTMTAAEVRERISNQNQRPN
jgi:hypothetical protein